MKEIITVPIQLESYDAIFNEIDCRPLNIRTVIENIDALLKEALFNRDLKQIPELNLHIFLPHSIKDCAKENLSVEGIQNYYQSFSNYENQIRRLSILRLIYYVLTALIFFIVNYYLQIYYPETFLNTLIDTSASVILWQASTMIFIDSKDFKLNKKLNELLSHVSVTYTYKD